MPHSIAVFLLGVGVIFIIAGVALPFILPKTKEKSKKGKEQIIVNIYNLDSKKEEQHQIPIIDDSKKLPERKELAYQMGLDVQEYERSFNAITNNPSYSKTADQFHPARLILNKLMDEWLFKSNLVLRNASQIKDIVYELNTKLNQYGTEINVFFDNRNNFEVYWSDYKKAPPEICNKSNKKVINYLWGIDSKSYKVQMNDLIRRLIILLNKEINDETEET